MASIAATIIKTKTTTIATKARAQINNNSNKIIKIASTSCFVPLAFETIGPICESGLSVFDDLGGRLAAVTRTRGNALFFTSTSQFSEAMPLFF